MLPRFGILLAFVVVGLGVPHAAGQVPPATEAQTPPPATDAEDPSGIARRSETVVVTASRTEQLLFDSPVAISVLGSAQIKTSAADNYADLLRGVPGVNVIQTSARDVSLRARGSTGVTENGQLVLLDGRSIYLDFYGVVLWDYIPLNFDEIRTVEVVRGPGSAVWGANALSGVINLRTKSPREITGGLLTLGGGELGTVSASARWAQAFERLSYKAAASYFEQDAWERVQTLPDGSPLPVGTAFKNEGTKQPKADLRVDFEPQPGTAWSFKLGRGGTSGIVHTTIGPFAIQPGAHVTYGEVDFARGGLDAKVYWNGLRGDAPNLINGLPFSFVNDTYVVDATDRHLVGGRHVIVAGANLRANRFDINLAPNESSRNDAGFFVEDLFTITPKLSLNFGGRVDYFDTLGATFSPRTSVLFRPTPAQQIRFAYNRAFRSPSLLEHFLDTPVPNAIPLGGSLFFFESCAVGNEDLEEENVHALELGYTLELGRRAVLTLSVYRNRVRDNIAFLPTSFFGPADPPPGWPLPPSTVPPFTLPKTFGFLNLGEVRDRGVELSADVDFPGGVSAHGSYTYQFAPRIINESAIPLFLNRPPRHQAALSTTVQKRRWYGSLGFTYSDDAFWTDVLDSRFWGPTDDYVLVNAGFGLRIAGERAELTLNATNLLDEVVQQHVFGDFIRRKVTAGLRLTF